MTIVVATPTGHVGARVVDKLIEAGADVAVIARSPAKLAPAVRAKAKVHEGSLEDAKLVERATKGADALFWLTPPNMTTRDLRGFMNELAKNAAAAIATNAIARVVNLSSLGAHLAKGLGPVSGLYDVEQRLDAAAKNVTHLRPGFFMENFLHQLDAIRGASSVFFPMAGRTRLAPIATRDIGDVAVRRLLDCGWSGRSVLGLEGPERISLDTAATVLSQAIGRPVKHVQVPGAAVRDALTKQGASGEVADQLVELYEALAKNESVLSVPGGDVEATSTTLLEWATDALAPLVR